jgi:ribosomal protein S18 acetylase RimI-like enzyme
MGAAPLTATLVAFRDDELATWLPVSLAEYVESRMGAGETREVATRIATEQRASLFPGGAPAPGHHLFRVVVDGERVGMVWLGPTADDDDVGRYLFNVEIDADKRGRGYGRAAMRAAEAWAATQGATRLSLNVWGGNDVARSLYDSLGYVVAATHMYRDL